MIVGIICDNTKKSFEECMKCCLTYDNKCHFLPQLLNAIFSNLKEENMNRKDVEFSVTSLLSCPRATVLNMYYDVYADIEHLYWQYRGTAFHKALERHDIEDVIKEERFYAKVNGVKVSGKIDYYDKKNKVLVDTKSTVSIPMYNKPWGEHSLQTNMYKYLLEENGLEVKKIFIQYLDMKMPKKIEVTIMPKEEVLKEIRSRIERINVDKTSIPVGIYNYLCKYCYCPNICLKIEKKKFMNEILKEILSSYKEKNPQLLNKLANTLETLIELNNSEIKKIKKIQEVSNRDQQ